MAEDDLQRRLTVFLTLDSVTTRVLAARLRQLFQWVLGPAEEEWPEVRLDGVVGAGAGSHALIVVTSRDRDDWACLQDSDPAALRIVYVQPELLAMRKALGQLWPDAPPAQAAWDQMVALDTRLRRFPILSSERVHSGDAVLWPTLAGQLEWSYDKSAPPPQVEVTTDTAAIYGEALHALLRPAPPGADLSTRPWTPSGRFPVRKNGEGLRFLGRGWSGPEQTHVWTHGRSAVLLIPHNGSGRGLTCRLQGMLALHPERGVNVLARAGGDLAITTGVPGRSCHVDLVLTLGSDAPPGVHVVEIMVDAPVQPSEAHEEAGDRRTLGVALQAVELRRLMEDVVPARPPPFLRGALARDFFQHRPHGLALVCASDQAVARSVAHAARRIGAARTAVAAPWPNDDQQDGLEAVSRVLAAMAGRPDLVVLCDPDAIAAWLNALESSPPSVLEAASVLLNTTDPDACGAAFYAYVQRWGARLEVSEAATAAFAWAPP